jgi:hypothetical protein
MSQKEARTKDQATIESYRQNSGQAHGQSAAMTGSSFSAPLTAPRNTSRSRQNLVRLPAAFAENTLAAKGRSRLETFGNNRSRTRILGNVFVTTQRRTKCQSVSCSIYDPRNLAIPY